MGTGGRKARSGARTDPARGRDPDAHLTWAQAFAWRLRRQRLEEPAADAIEAVATLAGVQAQVASTAAHVVAIRARDGDERTIERLLWEERRLVKTWAMRGTLHLLPARDYPTWIAALRTREWRITPGWERYHGVTKAELEAITAAIPEVLSAEPVTRDELANRVADAAGAHLDEALRSGWAAVLKPAANRGLLCQGPPAGSNVTFVDAIRWLDASATDTPPEPDEETALATVLRWFLDAYGPATHEDFARWFGITPAAARRVLAASAGDLALVDIEGGRAWTTPQGARDAAATGIGETAAGAPASVYLLPGFDPYVLGPISHRDHTIPPGRLSDVSRTAGWIAPVIVVDGRVAGTWAHDSGDEGTTVHLSPFGTLSPATLEQARRHLELRHHLVLAPPYELVS